MTDDNKDTVTQRDIYELAEKLDSKLDDLKDSTSARFNKVYYALTAMGLMIASPKVGGPSVPHVVEAIQRYFA